MVPLVPRTDTTHTMELSDLTWKSRAFKDLSAAHDTGHALPQVKIESRGEVHVLTDVRVGKPHAFSQGSIEDIRDHPDAAWIACNLAQMGDEAAVTGLLRDSVICVLHAEEDADESFHALIVLDDGEPMRLTLDGQVVITGAAPFP